MEGKRIYILCNNIIRISNISLSEFLHNCCWLVVAGTAFDSPELRYYVWPRAGAVTKPLCCSYGPITGP